MHKVEEDIANDIKENRPIDYVKYKNEFIKTVYRLEYKYRNFFYEKDKSGRDYMEKSMQYLTSGVYRLEKFMKEHPTYQIVGAEVDFTVTINDHLFGGKIDRLIKDTATDKYIIHDVKSYNTPKSEEELETPLQFVIYTAAVMQMYNIKLEDIKCGFDLPLCDVIQFGGTDGYMTRGFNKIKRLFSGIETNKVFTPKPSALCYWCDFCRTNPQSNPDYNHLCPYYCKWVKGLASNEVENLWRGLEDHEAIYKDFLVKYNITVKPRGGEKRWQK